MCSGDATMELPLCKGIKISPIPPLAAVHGDADQIEAHYQYYAFQLEQSIYRNCFLPMDCPYLNPPPVLLIWKRNIH
jgi:hypothetical protein